MRERLRANHYDLIHAHMGLSGWVARFQLRLPLVVSFLGNDVPGKVDRRGRTTLYGRCLELSSFVLARLVSAVIVKSEETKGRLKLDSARVIPNGVDLELFHPIDRDEARRLLGLSLEKKFVLFPYNPGEPRKRYDLVEAAVTRAGQRGAELEILHVSRLPHERVPLYMNAADLMVMASMMEGSPNAVKEALAVNLPVIAVNVGDTAELLGSTEGNYLVPRDVDVIAEKIVEVCRRGTRSTSRETVARRLSMESVARRIVAVYESVLPPRS
jgi:glycosyltransferase involved in cell wall biosynthesis